MYRRRHSIGPVKGTIWREEKTRDRHQSRLLPLLNLPRKTEAPQIDLYRDEIAEFKNVAPAAGHLAIGDAVGIRRNRLRQSRDRIAIEHAVAKVTEHNSVDRRLGYRMSQLLQYVSEIELLSKVSSFSRRYPPATIAFLLTVGRVESMTARHSTPDFFR